MGAAVPGPTDLSIAFLSHLASPHVSSEPGVLDDEFGAAGVMVRTIPTRSSR